ncbi:hypothetical protein Q7P37_009137 [Cladosporium fusiforme]
MSSRALRKAQREREEQQQLEKLQQQQEEEEEDDEPVVAPPKKSVFAMLGEEEDEDDDEEAQDPEDEGGVAVDEEPIQAAPAKAPSKKKKKKKAKGKSGGATPGTPAKQNTGKDEEPMDEIDAALKQLSTSGNASGQTAGGANDAINESSKLLAIDTHHLHAQNEMKRLFGRAALDQGGDDEGQGAPGNVGGNRRQQRRVQQVGLAQALRGQRGQGGRAGGLGSLSLRRNIFIQGKEEWPVATGGGLGMEVVSKNADGTVEYRYVHNRAYQDVQSQFESCVASMDPNRMVVLLQHNPYHISTLLQVSEIAKQENDHATAGDLLERALFSLGRAVHSTFAKNLAEGKARLDFSRPENREFWLASWRYMQNLSMRATWRTVYEWAKLLLSLAPEEDPYAIWLVLDQYAIRSQQSLDYLNISRNATLKAVHNDLPNVQLSQGLAEYRAGNRSKGQQALFTAIGRFPWVVARLMQELSIDPPPAIWGKSPRTDREKFHAELYATRAKDLWNTPEICEFLVEIASAIPPEVQSAAPDTSEITPNEARQILLSEMPPLIALIPREYTAQLTSTSDPLPPANNNISYEIAARPQHSGAMPRAAGASSAADNFRELQGLYGFFANLFPWFSPAGANTDGAPEPQPSEEEIQRRIQASGVSEETIMQRTERMMELQENLLGDQDDLGRGGGGGDDDDILPQPHHQTPDGAAQAARVAEAERQRRAHVEDADDNE